MHINRLAEIQLSGQDPNLRVIRITERIRHEHEGFINTASCDSEQIELENSTHDVFGLFDYHDAAEPMLHAYCEINPADIDASFHTQIKRTRSLTMGEIRRNEIGTHFESEPNLEREDTEASECFCNEKPVRSLDAHGDVDNDPDSDDDPLNDEAADDYNHALDRATTDDLNDSDRMECLSQEEFDGEAAQIWDEDSGLIVDVHEQYENMIKSLEEKSTSGRLNVDEKMYLTRLKGELSRYNEDGVVADGQIGILGPKYPEREGFFGETRKHRLQPDEIVSRFDTIDSTTGKIATNSDTGEEVSGRYASPEGTDFDSRAIPYDESKKAVRFYRIEPGADIIVSAGEVRDFFENKGTGAIQYLFEKRISEYVKDGQMYECDKEGNRIKHSTL